MHRAALAGLLKMQYLFQTRLSSQFEDNQGNPTAYPMAIPNESTPVVLFVLFSQEGVFGLSGCSSLGGTPPDQQAGWMNLVFQGIEISLRSLCRSLQLLQLGAVWRRNEAQWRSCGHGFWTWTLLRTVLLGDMDPLEDMNPEVGLDT